MKICGLNKTTLLDYPGKVAATIFIAGCNFRCPFCHNGPLVLRPDREPEIPQKDVLDFLKKRRGILEGVCVSGGEPTLYPELHGFLAKIRELGYAIKLDTNGSRPGMLRSLAADHLVDKIAMDIKACPERYGILCGLSWPDLDSIMESADFLIKGDLDYEFRTTVVRELHTEKDFRGIGRWLKGASACYLQAYKDSPGVLQPGFSSFSYEELAYFRDILRETIDVVEIRGID